MNIYFSISNIGKYGTNAVLKRNATFCQWIRNKSVFNGTGGNPIGRLNQMNNVDTVEVLKRCGQENWALWHFKTVRSCNRQNISSQGVCSGHDVVTIEAEVKTIALYNV